MDTAKTMDLTRLCIYTNKQPRSSFFLHSYTHQTNQGTYKKNHVNSKHDVPEVY